MAIADELVVVLKAENSQLLEGLKKAQEGLREIQAAMKDASEGDKKLSEAQDKSRKATLDATKDTKNAADAYKKFSGAIGNARSSFLSFRTLLSGFLVGAGLTSLVESVTKISNLSQITGQSVVGIKALGNVFEQLGYSAGEANSTIQNLSDGLAKARYGGGLSGLAIPLRSLGVQLFDKDGKPRDISEMLLEAGERVLKASNNDATVARMKLKTMGFDNATAFFMTDPRSRGLLAQEKAKAAIWQEQSKELEELNRQWKSLKQTTEELSVHVAKALLPDIKAVTGGLSKLADVAREHPEGLAKAIKAISIALLAAKGPIGMLLAALWAPKELYEQSKDWLNEESGKPQNERDSATRIRQAVVSGEHPDMTVNPENYDVDPKSEKTGDWGTGIYKKLDGWLDSGIDAFKEAWGKDPVTAAPSGKDGKNKAEQVIDHFMTRGYSADEARAIAANLQGESGFNEKAVGDGGKAYGLAQWHPDRQAQFKRVFGKDIRDATFREQMDFVDWELKNTHKKALIEMQRAKTLGDKTGALVRHYEIPADIAGATAKRTQIAMGYGGYQPQMVAMAKAQPSVVNHNNTDIRNDIRINVGTAKEAAEIAQKYTSGQKTNRRVATGGAV